MLKLLLTWWGRNISLEQSVVSYLRSSGGVLGDSLIANNSFTPRSRFSGTAGADGNGTMCTSSSFRSCKSNGKSRGVVGGRSSRANVGGNVLLTMSSALATAMEPGSAFKCSWFSLLALMMRTPSAT